MSTRSLALVLSCACLFACPAYADTQYDWWRPAGTSGALEDPANYRLSSTGDVDAPTTAPDGATTVAFVSAGITNTTMLATGNDSLSNLLAQAGQNTIQLQGFTLALANASLSGSNASLTQLGMSNGSLSAGSVSVGAFSTLSLSTISASVSQATTIAGTFNLAGNYTTGSLNAANATGFNFSSGNLTINGGAFAPQQSNQTLLQGSTTGQSVTFTNSAVISSAPGSTDTATLLLQNGAAASTAAIAGSNSNWFIGLNGGQGVVVATGAPSTLSTSSIFYIASGGTGSGATFVPSSGSIKLSEGSSASAVSTLDGGFGGIGTISVDGATSSLRNSSNLFVGESAFRDNGTYRPSHGTLAVTNGATAAATNAIAIGHAGGVGGATVDGAGSTLQAASVLIGDNYLPIGSSPPPLFGVGTLLVSNGGLASSSSDFIIGQTGGTGSVTVDGAGSTLQSTAGQLIIGKGRTPFTPSTSGTGTLILQNGGSASSFTNTLIGNSSGAGNVTVGNGNATSTLSVGANLVLTPSATGYAFLTINPGGRVTVAGSTILQPGTTPILLTINGGTLQTGVIQTSALLLGNNLEFHWTSGTLAITGAGGFATDSFAPDLALLANQTLRVTSTLVIFANNTLSLTGGTAVAANLSLAGSTGAYTSTLSISNGTLIVEPSANRAAAIATLRDELLYGQAHTTGITASALSANRALALLDNAIAGLTNFAGQPVDANAILIAPELLGDTNADGHVDLTDLNTVLNHLGQTTLDWTSGNFDGAATIDLNDLNDVLNNLGLSNATPTLAQSAQGLTAAAQTPEPASLSLLTAGTLLLLRRRRAR